MHVPLGKSATEIVLGDSGRAVQNKEIREMTTFLFDALSQFHFFLYDLKS